MSATQTFSWSVVVSLVALLAGWGAGGCRTYAAIDSRIKAVEVKETEHSQEFKELRDDVREINRDVKHLLERR
jgi:hypothetical protein